MSVYDNLVDGAYENTLPYPENPKRPAVLNKRASELTVDEIATLISVTNEYNEAVENARVARREYGKETARLENKFRDDLEAETRMVGHPKAGLLFSKAWEMGHSSGLMEVYNFYTDLIELVSWQDEVQHKAILLVDRDTR